VKLLQPKIVIPIHYNTFPLLKQDAGAWKARVESETSTKVKVLEPGEEITIGK
jgi:L-ascorbate metabolism protein UlaG (beta-lactamase superfamily)